MAIAVAVLAGGAATVGMTPVAGGPSAVPTAGASSGQSTVGAIFADGSADPLCTGAVVGGRAGDLVLTAAHCVSGTGTDLRFVPAWRSGHAPYGRWRVVAAYISPAWRTGQDPTDDVAVLKVAPHAIFGGSRSVQSVTGALGVGTAPRPGTDIDVIAYNQNDDTPSECFTKTYRVGGYPAFDCHGFVGGSSGSPWIHDGRVVGVIGGLRQGGCSEATSYSAPLGSQVRSLLRRANHEAQPDVVPQAGSDGC